jgi:hypothetical protein
MKKTFFIVGILTGFTAQAATFVVTPGAMGSGVISVPCAFDSYASLCTLDTGSDRSNVKKVDVIANYPSQGKTEQHGVAGVAQACDWIQVSQLTVGDAKLPKHQAARCDSNTPGNVIGFDVFLGRTIGLNFQTKLFDVSYDSLPLNLPHHPFWFAPGGLAALPVQVGNLELLAMWDTGAGLSVVDTEYAISHPELFTKGQEFNNGMDSNGNPVKMTVYLLKKITIGSKTFENTTFLAIDLSKVRAGLGSETHLILGYNIISQANWYIDTRTRSWSIY